VESQADAAAPVRAVFFDVDFTLIYPGPMFQGVGYQTFCAQHGIVVDPAAFDRAVLRAAHLLEADDDALYDAEIFVRYTRAIIEEMGGTGESLDTCARGIYAEWAANHHFNLYDDVEPVLNTLNEAGIRVGLISNSHRCLASFQEHFELGRVVHAAVSSSDHGFMKPHASIFRAAMELAGARPLESVMVGDSVRHDIEGALAAGMSAVFLHRGGRSHPKQQHLAERGVPTISSLAELPAVLASRPRDP
jgi:putative hydrolase of the HAD superfamily